MESAWRSRKKERKSQRDPPGFHVEPFRLDLVHWEIVSAIVVVQVLAHCVLEGGQGKKELNGKHAVSFIISSLLVLLSSDLDECGLLLSTAQPLLRGVDWVGVPGVWVQV